MNHSICKSSIQFSDIYIEINADKLLFYTTIASVDIIMYNTTYNNIIYYL